jgi:hypothetical protein
MFRIVRRWAEYAVTASNDIVVLVPVNSLEIQAAVVLHPFCAARDRLDEISTWTIIRLVSSPSHS